MKGKTEVAKEIAKKHGSRDLIVMLGGGGVVKNQETTISIAESNGKHGVITLSVDSCVFDPLSKASKEIPIVHNKTAEAFSEELMNSLRSVASKREIKNPFKEEDGCQLSSRYAGSLISGKEAYNAVLDGQEVEWLDNTQWSMFTMSTAWAPSELSSGKYKFRVKPRTISINGIELPAPFKPKEGDEVYILSDAFPDGYVKIQAESYSVFVIGAWKTEEEIKQVVEALRSFLGGKQ